MYIVVITLKIYVSETRLFYHIASCRRRLPILLLRTSFLVRLQ